MSKPVPWATWKMWNTFCDNLEQALAQFGKNYLPSNIYNLIVKRSLCFCQNKKITNPKLHPKITLYYKVE